APCAAGSARAPSLSRIFSLKRCSIRPPMSPWATPRRTSRGNTRFTRGEDDAFAAQSFERAVAAPQLGFFAGELAPVKSETFERAPYQPRALKLKGVNELAADTHVRPSPLETLAAIRPAFGGVQTGGNSSAIVDGAAAALVASSGYVRT